MKKKAFEYYILAQGITKRGLLLHCAGIEEKELFETLQDPGVAEGKNDRVDEYQIPLRTLDAHFSRRNGGSEFITPLRKQGGIKTAIGKMLMSRFVIKSLRSADRQNYGENC